MEQSRIIDTLETYQASSVQPKATRSANYYLSSMMKHRIPCHYRAMRLTNHHAVRIKRQLKPNTSPLHLTVKAEIKQLGDIPTTCGKNWTIMQDILDRSTDREDMPRHVTTATYSDVTSLVTPGPKTADGLHPSCVATWPDIEAPHIPSASVMK